MKWIGGKGALGFPVNSIPSVLPGPRPMPTRSKHGFSHFHDLSLYDPGPIVPEGSMATGILSFGPSSIIPPPPHLCYSNLLIRIEETTSIILPSPHYSPPPSCHHRRNDLSLGSRRDLRAPDPKTRNLYALYISRYFLHYSA